MFYHTANNWNICLCFTAFYICQCLFASYAFICRTLLFSPLPFSLSLPLLISTNWPSECLNAVACSVIETHTQTDKFYPPNGIQFVHKMYVMVHCEQCNTRGNLLASVDVVQFKFRDKKIR